MEAYAPHGCAVKTGRNMAQIAGFTSTHLGLCTLGSGLPALVSWLLPIGRVGIPAIGRLF